MREVTMRITVTILVLTLLLACLPGTVEGNEDGSTGGSPVILRDRAEVALITGYVNDTSGNALNNADVRLKDPTGGENSTKTNETGMYEIWSEPGQVTLIVFHHGHRGQNRTFTAINGENPNVNFTLAPLGPELVTITGFVNSTEGGHVGGAFVYLTDDDTWENATLSNETTGRYRINCVNGTVMMVVVMDGFQWFVKNMNVADHQVIELDVELIPMAEATSFIKGYVTDEGGAVVDDIKVDVFNNTMLYHNSTRTDVQGYYEIGVISDWLHLIIHDDNYFEFHDYFFMDENRTIWVNITLREMGPRTARFFGKVVDEDTGDPIAGANVEAELQEMDWGVQDTTDANGDFELFLYEGYYEGEIQADGYFSDDFDFNIVTDENFEMGFELEKAPPKNSLIKGYIRDERGAPMDVQMVVAFDFMNDTETMNITQNGYYEMPSWSANFIVAAMAQGYSMSGQAVYVPPDSTVWVNLTMYEVTSIVRGYVINAGGDRLQDAEVSLIDDLTISMDGFNSNETGYYEAPTHAGTFAMIVSGEGGDFMEAGEYEPYVDEITIPDRTEVWINVTLYESESNPMSVDITFTDWDHAVQQGEAPIPRNKTMETRLFLDTILGNGDMTISDEELEAMTKLFKDKMLIGDEEDDDEDGSPFEKYSNDTFLLDGICYVIDEDSADVSFEGYDGAWDSPGTARMTFYAEYNSTEPIPDSLTHELQINMSWKYADEGGEEEFRLSFPDRFAALDWEPVENMTITGDNPWVIAPGINPYREYEEEDEDPVEGTDYVWIHAFVNRTYNTTDNTPGNVDCGENLTFELEMDEWEDVDTVTLLWLHEGGSEIEPLELNGTDGVYTHTINVPKSEARDIEYRFIASIDGSYAVRVPHLGYAEVDVVDAIAPAAALSVSPALAMIDANVTLNASASTDNIDIVLYNFTFGDGTFMETNLASVEHTYNASGTFEIMLTVWDAEGNEANTTAKVRVTNDTARPTIISTIPENRAVGVNPDTPVEAVFSEDIDPHSLTIECDKLEFKFEYYGANRTAVVEVNGTLEFGETYVFSIGASDLVGHALKLFNLSFTVIEWNDYDNDRDGVLNGKDAFPDNPTGAVDTDGDGKPDRLLNASGWNGTMLEEDLDDDGDNWTDVDEIRLGTKPLDPKSFPADLDGDGTADEEDEDIDGDGVPNEKDDDPLDSSVGEVEKRSSNTGLVIIAVVVILVLGGIIALVLFLKRKPKPAPEPEFDDLEESEDLEAQEEGGGPMAGIEGDGVEAEGDEWDDDWEGDVENLEGEMEDFDDGDFESLDDDELPPPDDDFDDDW